MLSVETVSPAARTITIRLTYLASGFDWRASCVATLAPNDRALDLFASPTLGNGNFEGFANAEVRQFPAGSIGRQRLRYSLSPAP